MIKRMRKIVMLLAAVVIAASLSGCVKFWEQERIETIPLPETEIPVTPEPWEQPPESNLLPAGE
jgi:ABC-type uncharacterized transport system auxiliary subunit